MKIQVKDRNIPCEVKTSIEGLRTGMMKRGNLNGCMAFILPHNGKQSFWMLDCLIPLDIVFCENNIVTMIHKNCPPCESEQNCPSYQGRGNLALEFNAGFCDELGLKLGDEVRLQW